jgi:hypothetical protein
MHRPRPNVCLEHELKPDINRLARSRLISASSESAFGIRWRLAYARHEVATGIIVRFPYQASATRPYRN